MNFGNLNVVRKQICRKLTHDVYDEYTQAGLYSNDDYEDEIHSQIEELQQRLINLQCFNEMKTILYELKRNSDKINKSFDVMRKSTLESLSNDSIECIKDDEICDIFINAEQYLYTWTNMFMYREKIQKEEGELEQFLTSTEKCIYEQYNDEHFIEFMIDEQTRDALRCSNQLITKYQGKYNECIKKLKQFNNMLGDKKFRIYFA